MTTKELLTKFAEINSYHIQKQKELNTAKDTIKMQEEYLTLLNELKEKNSEKAKIVAMEHLKQTGIFNDKEELAYPYNMSQEDANNIIVDMWESYVQNEKEKGNIPNIPIVNAKTLIKKDKN